MYRRNNGNNKIIPKYHESLIAPLLKIYPNQTPRLFASLIWCENHYIKNNNDQYFLFGINKANTHNKITLHIKSVRELCRNGLLSNDIASISWNDFALTKWSISIIEAKNPLANTS